MTDYFNLLRHHQKNPEQQESRQQEVETSVVNDDAMLISEETLAAEDLYSPPLLEDELLCEEEEESSVEDASLHGATAEEKPYSTHSVTESRPTPPVAPPVTVANQLPYAQNSDHTTTEHDKDEATSHIAQWLASFITMIDASLRHCRQHEPCDMNPLEKHITNLLIWLEREPTLINTLELELEATNLKKFVQSGQDDLIQLIMKSVMMLLYCIKTSVELKISHDTGIRLMMASVLQHIGMAQIPPDILSKTGRLSPDELAEIRDAPARGSAYLQSCGIEDEYILRGAAESNERVDGSGPRGLQGKDICYSARLIGLLSMFEAMIHVRSYRKRMLPREAVRVVVQKFKPAFERSMLKALLDAISLYPIGSVVRLNSKEIGKVISCLPRLPLRPKVRITMDEYGDDIPYREIDLKKHPNLMIEQCAYEDDIQTLLHE